MASRAHRSTPRHTPRRGAGAYQRSPLPLPPFNGYTTELISPISGFSTPDRTPEITLVGTSTVSAPVDIQLEWRMVLWTELTNPPAVYTTELLDAVSGTPQLMSPPADLTYRTWYYRARTGDKSTNTWGQWTAQKWLNVRPVIGSAAQYIDINVGVTDPPLLGAFAYIDLNVGTDPDAQEYALTSYIDLNVGIEEKVLDAFAYVDINVALEKLLRNTHAYTDINVVATETPVPHIWWIRPEQGKDGYTFNIFGHGFGAFQNEYTGKVLLGNFVCDIARWEILPSALLPVTVEVAGTPRATSSLTLLPKVLLNSAPIVAEAGDTIEYDMKWELPAGQRLDIFPSFTASGLSNGIVGTGVLLNDTLGRAWVSDQPEAYGSWFHRTFVIPSGHTLVGRTLNDFNISWFGFDVSAPVRTAAFRSMVVRRADGTPKLWVMGDDHLSSPPLTYTANGGILQNATLQQEGFVIDRGIGLDPDTITSEYGWIVAVVPSGAVSSMVRVVLEDD